MIVNNISAVRAKTMYDNKILFIDIRELEENKEVRIPNTDLLPLSEIQNRWNEIPRDIDVVIYCRTGNRSGNLIYQLFQLGYENLYNLDGGIVDWYHHNFPIETGVPKNGDD